MAEKLTRSQCRDLVLAAINRPLSEDIEDSCWELPEAFNHAHQIHKKGEPTYILPGLSKLSETIGGWPHQGTTIITGGTGLGKSTLIGNLWVHLSSFRKNIYTVPIEIGGPAFMDMLVSIIAAKNRRKIRAEDYAEAREKWLPTFLANRGHVIAKHTSRLSHLDFLTEVYYHWRTRNVTVAFGDNWNFMMEPESGSDANAKSDRALHDIIVFTKVFPIHIFMIMHPKKDRASKEKTDNRVTSLDDIKGSSTSPQEAANVLLFNALEDPKDGPPPVIAHPDYCREITVAKARGNGRARGSKVIFYIDQHSELYHEYIVR